MGPRSRTERRHREILVDTAKVTSRVDTNFPHIIASMEAVTLRVTATSWSKPTTSSASTATPASAGGEDCGMDHGGSAGLLTASLGPMEAEVNPTVAILVGWLLQGTAELDTALMTAQSEGLMNGWPKVLAENVAHAVTAKAFEASQRHLSQ